MAQYVYTSREFRDRQSEAFSRVDAGDRVIVRPRNRRGGYLILGFTDDQMIPSPEFLAKVEKGRSEFLRGETFSFDNKEDMNRWLDSL
ncbi:MAG: hypothetical protein LUC85_06350 [Bacteroidales bacterium]|nr:hypothetical protein [Bacteroidales bacterium]MCD8394439.1 hypothetical protein [Bacteroidales bacterium]